MLRLTVRGDIEMPSFNSSSAAIRSSPHVRFAVAISAINCCRFTGIRGRPRGRDFQRQNRRNPWRCQGTSVSGCTTVRMSRESIIRESTTRVTRVALSARRGLTFRSRYNASCLRRKRFSAAKRVWDRRPSATKHRISPKRASAGQTITACDDSSHQGRLA